jgi:hypothetical protein
MLKSVAAAMVAANAALSIEAANLALQNRDELLVGALCATGIVLAFAGAAAAHLLHRRTENPNLDLRYYRMRVEFTGEADPQREAMLEQRIRDAARFDFVAPLMACGSALMFVAGGLLILFG